MTTDSPRPTARFDLAVIGAGPGGSVCALAAARMGLSVLLFEPQAGPIDKPCGEGCLASGVRVLSELGFETLLARAKLLRGVTYALPDGLELCVPFPQVGYAIERPQLAAELDAALARESAVRRVAASAQAQAHAGRFLLRAGELHFEARTLAVADGVRGRGADWLRGETWLESGRFGLRARFEAKAQLDGVLILIGDADAQTYVTPLPEGRINVALLLDRAPASGGARALLESILRQPRLARLVGAELSAPELRSLARREPRAPAREGVFLVGDAAGGVDPIVGYGVSVALSTGLAAARGAAALLQGSQPRRVEREYARIVHRETVARARLARLLLHLARRPARARLVMSVLARAPRAAALLARVAEG